MVKQMKKADIGDLVYFSKEQNKFVFYKPTWNIPENDPAYISIGIVLAQTSTFKTTVLIKSFLMEDALRIPFSYMSKP